ncbi:hypothetical protein FSP39_012299 [Pinctada imbricata]|uniref:Reverse transcriptase domain-containing protein n=1 Tax=Pinctada imbricata TaxID=66713 RepID=A0AA89C7E7_PINIB|nr:hypothetical protein FSP39_012299 [Pinctada imbricata]
MVLDCRHINPHLFQFKFKYENGEVAKVLFSKGDYMFTFDLKSAYHHIMINEAFYEYLGFYWDKHFYVFKVLPFGLATAGFIFSKVTREIVRYWRSLGHKLIMYLDDGLAGSDTSDKSEALSHVIREDLQKFGFLLADEKCDWVPKQKVIWLGLIWDMESGLMHLTEERLQKLAHYIDIFLAHLRTRSRVVDVKFLASIVGQLISAQSVFGQLVRLRTRNAYECINERLGWKSKVYITKETESEMEFWLENAELLNKKGNSFSHLTESTVVDLKMYCDASGEGYGGYLANENDEILENSEMFGNWISTEISKSSTWRELEAVNRVLHQNLEHVKGKTVQVFTDNKNVKHIPQVGSKKSCLNKIGLEILDTCDTNDVRVISHWIPRTSNIEADRLSRCFDCDDWGIQWWVYLSLDFQWGPHTYDRFASVYNRKCDKFSTKFWCKEAHSVDAFNQRWTNENNWLVPPPSLISNVIKKITKEEVTGIHLKKHVDDQLESSGVAKGTYLHSLSSSLSEHLVHSRSDNTSKTYLSGFRRWENFIEPQGFSALPAHPVHVALYITHLMDSGTSCNVVNNAVYSIKWAHDLNGLADPTCNTFVKNLQDSARRRFRPRRQRKDPETSDMLIQLCEMFQYDNDLLVIRDLCMILLSFSGFLRYDEVSSLACNDVTIFDDYVSLIIRKSKTDQYRNGNEVLISCGTTIACPVKMLRKYVNIAQIDLSSDHFLFKPVYRSKDKCGLIYKNKKLSYTAAKSSIISRLKLVAKDLDLGLHSMRAGGATQAANSSAFENDRCWKRHGRWKSESSKDGYVKDSVENRLSVSKSLGL